jgi:magnesium-transporting ATPase (P-type)
MIVFGEIFYLINCRRIYTSSLNIDAMFGSKPALIAIIAVIVLQLLFTYVPLMQHFFGTTNIDLMQWSRIVVCSIAIFFIVEFEKWLARKCGRRKL